MRQQFVRTVSNVIENNEKTVLLLGDIGVWGFREILSRFPDRAYNIGILEQSTVGLSSGMSLCGLTPIIHTIAPFLVERALEQIKVDLCYQGLGVNLVSVGGSYDYSALGPTHHCPADIPTLNEIPEIQLIVPGHELEFDSLFNQTYENGSTTYYRLSETSNLESHKVSFGRNLIIRQGRGPVIISVGPSLQAVLEATVDLDPTIIYCTTVKPFDFASLEPFLSQTLIVVEPYYSGSILTNILRSNSGVTPRVKSIGVPNEFIAKYGKKEEVDRLIGLDVESLRSQILKVVRNEK